MENVPQKVRTDEILAAPALFVIVVNVALHEKCTHLQPI